MKKKLLFTLISSMFIFTLSGCKTKIVLKNQAPSMENTDKIGNYIKKADLSFNDVTYRRLLDEALSDVKGAQTYDEVYAAIEKALIKTSDLIEKYYISEALYYYDSSNLEYVKYKETYQNLYYEYETFRANLIYEMSDSRDLLKQFFNGYSDEDIDFEIELATKKKEDRYKQIKEEIDEIQDEFDKIELSLSDKKNDDKILELLYRFVNKNNELSEYLGFDSYVNYRDITYNRIYTQTDVNNFIENAKNYLMPLMDNNGNFIDCKSKVSSLSTPEYSFLYEFEYTSIYDKDYKTKRLLDDYSKKMGGSYYKYYNNFFDNGHFLFGNKGASVKTAYTNDYLSYFGPNYQKASTVIHEFGHYYSMNNSNCLSKSLDLQEFYSQANEYLFNSYLEQYSQKNLKKVFDTTSCLLIDSACNNILIASSLREFENRIYSATLSQPSDIYGIWNDIVTNEYDGRIKDYWKIEVRYDVYYLSYATSVVGALSLYDYSKTSFNDAKVAYIKASGNYNIDDDLEEILKKSGLVSPFSEDAFKLIKKLVEEKR